MVGYCYHMSNLAANYAGRTVGVRDLSHHTSQVLNRVRSGERLVVTDRGEPVALVIPLRPSGHVRPAVGYASSGDPAWAAQAADEMRGFGE